jgi:hypothetical protein
MFVFVACAVGLDQGPRRHPSSTAFASRHVMYDFRAQ